MNNFTSVTKLDRPVGPDVIEEALQAGTADYFYQCRQRVPGFVQQNFRYPGCWHNNKAALGLDLLRAPLNLLWAPVFALVSGLRVVCLKLGWARLANTLARLPDGCTTQVQRHIASLIQVQLLQRSKGSDWPDGLRDSILSALEASIAYSVKRPLDHQLMAAKFAPLIDDALIQYRVARTASSDITNTVMSTVIGAFAFQKFTPGGLGIGFLIAGLIAKYWGVRDFILGDFLGRYYYALWPAQPSIWLITGSVLGVLLVMAVLASLAGLIADPIQSWLGIHRRRLLKMLDHLERDFIEQGNGSFRPKDQFIARVLEVLDAIKAQIN